MKTKIQYKKRPRRLFYDDKKKKYFYIINKRKYYIKVDRGTTSDKKIANINIRNIQNVPIKPTQPRPRRIIKPIVNQQIVSKLIPIAPVSQNLTDRKLFMGEEELKKRLEKLETGFKPVDVKPEEKEEEEEKEEGVFIGRRKKPNKKPILKAPKPTNSSVLLEAMRLIRQRRDDEKGLQEKKFKEDLEEGVERGFTETNPDPELEDVGDLIVEQPRTSIFPTFSIPAVKKTNWSFNDDFKTNLKSIVSNWKLLKSDEQIEQARTNFNETLSVNRVDKNNIGKDKFKQFIIQLQKEREDDIEEKTEEPLSYTGLSSIGMGVGFRPYETILGEGAYSNDDDGIYNDELQKIFKDKTNKFLPVISSDNMNTLIPMVNRNTKRFGWIQNTEPMSSMGRHWVAWFIDIPNYEINFYDSLVENDGVPTKQSLKGLKKIVDKINPEYYLLLKYNTIREQHPNSRNCGYFSLKFLMDRYSGVDFKEATGYNLVYGDDVKDNYKDGEMEIKKFKMYL